MAKTAKEQITKNGGEKVMKVSSKTFRFLFDEGFTTLGWWPARKEEFYKNIVALLPDFVDVSDPDKPKYKKAVVSAVAQAKGFNRVFKDMRKAGIVLGDRPDGYKFRDKAALYREYILQVNPRSELVILTSPYNKRVNEVATAPWSSYVINVDGESATLYDKMSYLSAVEDATDDPSQIVVGKTIKCTTVDLSMHIQLPDGEVFTIPKYEYTTEEVPLHLSEMHKYEDTDPQLLDEIFELSAITDIPDYMDSHLFVAPDRDACGVSDLYDHAYERGNYAGFKMNYRIGGIDPDDVPGTGKYMTKMSRKNLHRYYGKYSNCTEQEYIDTKEYMDALSKWVAISNENLKAMLNDDEQFIVCPNCGELIRHSENPLLLLKGRYKYCQFCGYEVDEDVTSAEDYTSSDDNYAYDTDADDYEYLQNKYLSEDNDTVDSLEEDAE